MLHLPGAGAGVGAVPALPVPKTGAPSPSRQAPEKGRQPPGTVSARPPSRTPGNVAGPWILIHHPLNAEFTDARAEMVSLAVSCSAANTPRGISSQRRIKVEQSLRRN